jgi:hypothetical protein
MGLDLWFQQDVARILAATHETMRSSMGAAPPLDPELAESYQQGFGDALHAVAVAFGVAVPAGREPDPLAATWQVVNAPALPRGENHERWSRRNGHARTEGSSM